MEDNENIPLKLSSPRDHLANERTYLAWIRTALGVIVFGVVMDRFTFENKHLFTQSRNFSQYAGLLLVTVGMLITVFAFIRFRTIEKEIDKNTYKPHLLLTTALTIIMIALGSILIWILLA